MPDGVGTNVSQRPANMVERAPASGSARHSPPVGIDGQAERHRPARLARRRAAPDRWPSRTTAARTAALELGKAGRQTGSMSQTSRTRETETLDSTRSAPSSFSQICKAWKAPHLSEKAQSRMPAKETLQAFLSPQRLRELAGPKVYARGEKYADGGAVRLHEHTRDEAIGEVMGSQPYRVGLRLTPKGLVAECTCPAMSDYGFCKHAVALGLRLIDAPPPTAKRTAKSRRVVPDDFTERYPNIAGWIKDGWIEIGRDGHSTSVIRVLDEGGLIWEGGTRHRSMDKILQEAEDAIADWMQNN